MKSLKFVFVAFTLFFSIVFGICEVFGEWSKTPIAHHPVRVENDASEEVGFFGGAEEHRFADIRAQVYYSIHKDNGTKARSTAYSCLDMSANTIAFRGFASISGTADAGHTQQFSATKTKAVKTDTGVLDPGVNTSLVNDSGHPKMLSDTDFKTYKKWYDKVPQDQQEKWGDSESFSYNHSDNSFYTAMKYHPVHFGEGFNLWTKMKLKDPVEARDLSLSDSASLVKDWKKELASSTSDADIIGLFSPYARAHGEGFNFKGHSISNPKDNNTVPSVSVDTTEPKKPDFKKADADEYNFGIMFAANDVYTASAGDTHESVMYLSHIASSVKWYVGSTFIETDSNTDEPRMSWNIPSDASGDYVIKAEVTPSSGSSYDASYTLSVSGGSSVGTSSSTSPSYSLVSSDGVYTATAGTGHESNFTTNSPYSSVYWYVKSPGDTSYYGTNVRTESGDGSKMTSQLDYSFPSGVSGDYQFLAYVYDGDYTTIYETSYTVSVSLPSNGTPPTSTPTPTLPSVSISPYGSYTSTVGINANDNTSDPYALVLTASEPFREVKWYYTTPGGTEWRYDTQSFSGGETTSTCWLGFYNGPGEYGIRAEVSIAGVVYNATYTVTAVE